MSHSHKTPTLSSLLPRAYLSSQPQTHENCALLNSISAEFICSEVAYWWALHGRETQELCKIQAQLHALHPSDLPGLSLCFRRKLDVRTRLFLTEQCWLLPGILWSYACLQIDFFFFWWFVVVSSRYENFLTALWFSGQSFFSASNRDCSTF